MVLSDVLIGFGANLGQPADVLDRCLQELARCCEDVRASSVSRTRAVRTQPIATDTRDVPDRTRHSTPDYANAVIRVRTGLSCEAFWHRLQEIERALGRKRTPGSGGWQSRIADLDLLLFDDQIRDEGKGLQLPHPWLGLRRFVLEPAAELAADWVEPLSGLKIAELLALLDQPLPLQVLLPGGARERFEQTLCTGAGKRSWRIHTGNSAATTASWTLEPNEPDLAQRISVVLTDTDAITRWDSLAAKLPRSRCLLVPRDPVLRRLIQPGQLPLSKQDIRGLGQPALRFACPVGQRADSAPAKQPAGSVTSVAAAAPLPSLPEQMGELAAEHAVAVIEFGRRTMGDWHA